MQLLASHYCCFWRQQEQGSRHGGGEYLNLSFYSTHVYQADQCVQNCVLCTNPAALVVILGDRPSYTTFCIL